MLSVGEVWEQSSSFRAQRVFPGETSLKNKTMSGTFPFSWSWRYWLFLKTDLTQQYKCAEHISDHTQPLLVMQGVVYSPLCVFAGFYDPNSIKVIAELVNIFLTNLHFGEVNTIHFLHHNLYDYACFPFDTSKQTFNHSLSKNYHFHLPRSWACFLKIYDQGETGLILDNVKCWINRDFKI